MYRPDAYERTPLDANSARSGKFSVKLHLKLRRPDSEVLKDQPYESSTGNVVGASGMTDGEGVIRTSVPTPKGPLTLFLPERERRMTLEVGALKSLEQGSGVEGAQGRLSNLGFGLSAINGSLDERTRLVLQAVQMAADLPLTGELDSATKDELLRLYGC